MDTTELQPLVSLASETKEVLQAGLLIYRRSLCRFGGFTSN